MKFYFFILIIGILSSFFILNTYEANGLEPLISPPFFSKIVNLEFDAPPMEITQAIQTRNNDLPLVSNKDTVVRVYLNEISSNSERGTILLHGERNGIPLPSSPLIEVFDPVRQIDRTVLKDTANFQIPKTWTSGTIKLWAEVPTESVFGMTNEILPSLKSSVIEITFFHKKTPTYYIVPINNATGSTQILPSTPEIQSQQSYLENVFPLPDVNFRIAIPMDCIGCKLGEVNDFLNEQYQLLVLSSSISSPPTFGLLPDQIYGFTATGGGLSDPTWGSGTGKVSSGYRGSSLEGTMAHEINHNLDTSSSGDATWGKHVSNPDNNINDPNWGCDADGGDKSWPTPPMNDSILRNPDSMGFDIDQFKIITGMYPDFMSYCQSATPLPTKWISDYRWGNLFDAFPGETLPPRNVLDVLYISGTITSNGQANIDPIFANPGISFNIRTTGEYTLEITNEENKVESHSFSISFIDAEGNPRDSVSFFKQIPYDTIPSKIQIKHKEKVLSEVNKSPNSPTIEILSPKSNDTINQLKTIKWKGFDSDGDKLTYAVFFSPDDGRNWSPISNKIQEEFLQVDWKTLPVGKVSKIRIIASDGINTSQTEVTLSSFESATPFGDIRTGIAELPSIFISKQPFIKPEFPTENELISSFTKTEKETYDKINSAFRPSSCDPKLDPFCKQIMPKPDPTGDNRKKSFERLTTNTLASFGDDVISGFTIDDIHSIPAQTKQEFSPRTFSMLSPQVQVNLIDDSEILEFNPAIKHIFTPKIKEFKSSLSLGSVGQSINTVNHPQIFISPSHQFEYGIPTHLIACNDGLFLAEKQNTNEPICVTSNSIKVLKARGFI